MAANRQFANPVGCAVRTVEYRQAFRCARRTLL